MREIAEREVASWPVGAPFRLHGRMQAVTLEVIMRIVFGVDEGDPRLATLRERLRHFLATTAAPREVVRLMADGPERAYRRRIFASVIDPVDEVIAQVIADRRRRDDLADRDDVLSCCCSPATRTAARWTARSCATSCSRCWSPGTRRRRPRWPGRPSGSCATPRRWTG